MSRESNKDVYLLTSHMVTPSLYLRQVGDLSVDKRRLGIPAELPKPKAPAHLFEPDTEAVAPQPPQPPQPPQVPAMPKSNGLSEKMANARMSSNNGTPAPTTGLPTQRAQTQQTQMPSTTSKPPKEEEKKKKRLGGILSSLKK